MKKAVKVRPPKWSDQSAKAAAQREVRIMLAIEALAKSLAKAKAIPNKDADEISRVLNEPIELTVDVGDPAPQTKPVVLVAAPVDDAIPVA